MATKYADLGRDALEMVKEFGAPVTFTLTTPGTYDETTGNHSSPTEVTVKGHAVQDEGDPVRYRELELIESEAPTLLFAPNVIGTLPAVGSSVSWGGAGFKASDIAPIAPDGTAIAASIIVVR